MANTNCKHCREMRQVVRLGEKYWVIKCQKFPGEWRRLHDSCGSGWCERFEEKFGKRRGRCRSPQMRPCRRHGEHP